MPASQSRAFRSSLAVTTSRPSGLNSACRSERACSIVKRSRPVATSQIRASAPSGPPV